MALQARKFPGLSRNERCPGFYRYISPETFTQERVARFDVGNRVSPVNRAHMKASLVSLVKVTLNYLIINERAREW